MLSSEKEFTYKLKSNNSAVTFETKILSKTIFTGKLATISHIVKYKSSTFIAQLNYDDKEDIVFFCDQYGKYGIDTPLVTKVEFLPRKRGHTYKIDEGFNQTWEILKTL